MARLSGTWTLTAIAKLAAWDQRIVIAGSTNADGAHPMVAGTVVPNVRGVDFEVKPQAFNPVLAQWLDSFQVDSMSWDPIKGVMLTISADDRSSTPDADFNDLVVVCTTTDPELMPPRFNAPRMDLTIPERYVREKAHRRPMDPGGSERKRPKRSLRVGPLPKVSLPQAERPSKIHGRAGGRKPATSKKR